MSKSKASAGGDSQTDNRNSEANAEQEVDIDLFQEVADDTGAEDDEMGVEDTQVINGGPHNEGGSAADDVDVQDGSADVIEQAGALAEELAAARLEVEGFHDRYLRAQAELENERRKHERELKKAHKFALEKIAVELLDVRDNLERGLEAARAEGTSVELIIEGTELTLKSLSQVMDKFSIVAVDPAGEKFNPDYHQAISMQPAEGVASGTITVVIQKGYTLNERLIRPAMVVVAK